MTNKKNVKSDYDVWVQQLKEVYRRFGIEHVEIIGDVLYPTAYDAFIGRGYDLRKVWEENEEPIKNETLKDILVDGVKWRVKELKL